MSGALTRYRLIAYVVGVVLILLVVVGMPMKYLFDEAVVVETIGPGHGFLYMVYLVAAFDLARRAGWPLGRILKIMLAGTVPFVSFWAERVVTRWAREAIDEQASGRVAVPAGDAVRPASVEPRDGAGVGP
ncbi:DUF3817 domain-containing protein [Micromonospora sp. LOL_023]|uniref:DUF3817 domain-containing protein n=1 Tax=Micromonospora sp. LOL_023 TaxID=3345418 RepID=UPI003A84D1F4